MLSLPVVFVPVASSAAPPDALPFERTEVRVSCDNYDPLKQPLFGELHLHTAYSFDAGIIDTRNTPENAYNYARGERVGLAPWTDSRQQFDPAPVPPASSPVVTSYPYCFPGERCQFMATTTAQLPAGRALDFAAITDHAEQFGEGNICLFEPVYECLNDGNCPLGQVCQGSDPPSPGMCVPQGYNDPLCILARDEISKLSTGTALGVFLAFENLPENPSRPPFCDEVPGDGGSLCLLNAKHVWDQIQQDAEHAYDRSSACTFTSFVAYEYTAILRLAMSVGSVVGVLAVLPAPAASDGFNTRDQCQDVGGRSAQAACRAYCALDCRRSHGTRRERNCTRIYDRYASLVGDVGLNPLPCAERRDFRYCELWAFDIDQGTDQGTRTATARVYNSDGGGDPRFGNCPTPNWEKTRLDVLLGDVAEELEADFVEPNGQRFWTMDTIRGLRPPADTREEINDILYQLPAILTVDNVVNPPYTPVPVTRDTVFTYDAEKKVYVLTDTDENDYLMQSATEPEAGGDFDNRGDQLNLPSGWTYTPILLEFDCELDTADSGGVAMVLQDDDDASYQRNEGSSCPDLDW